MIERKIKLLRDITLNTNFETHYLVEGEVRIIKFRNRRSFEGLLRLGNFIEAGKDEKEVKVIPVIVPEVDENTIVEMDNTVFINEKQPIEPVEVEEPVEEEMLEDREQSESVQVNPRDEYLAAVEEVERAAVEDLAEVDFEKRPVEEVPIEEVEVDEIQPQL